MRLCAAQPFARYAREGVLALGAIAASDQHYETAARMRGAAHAMGYPSNASDRAIDDRLECDYFAPARARHGTDRWRRAEASGAVLSYDEVIALALDASSSAGARLLELPTRLEQAGTEQIAAADPLGAEI